LRSLKQVTDVVRRVQSIPEFLLPKLVSMRQARTNFVISLRRLTAVYEFHLKLGVNITTENRANVLLAD